MRLLLSAILVFSAPAVYGERVFISNATGSIDIKIVNGSRVNISKKATRRALEASDVSVTRDNGVIDIKCNPRDGAEVNLGIELPIGLPVRAETLKGNISVEGFAGSMDLFTDSGDIRMAVPWQATRLMAQSYPGEPSSFITPPGLKFTSRSGGKKDVKTWWAENKIPDRRITYGVARIQAKYPGKIELVDIPIPEKSPLKMPWQAVKIVDDMLRPLERKGKASSNVTATAAATPSETKADDGSVTFRSDVRVVALSVSVTNKNGEPVPGLKAEQFEVLEDGVVQEVKAVASEEAPFNLGLLLDLSGSTQQERDAMQKATERFYGIARPEDRVALYALAESFFMVLSPLTNDRKMLERAMRAVPMMSGGSPVYDTIVLSYAEEMMQRPLERNALIVISDGIDNQLAGEVAPSEVSFAKLVRAAEGWNALVYPIFLDPYTRVPPPRHAVKAKQQMSQIAEVTGGKLFVAQSLSDLEPVYPKVAEELRSVYSVTYSPKNQNFDGGWRKVQVKVKASGAQARTRSGYVAR